MTTIRTTPEYDAWFSGLRDRQAKQRINIRIRRVSLGNFGDVKPVGEGVSELRIDYGPGYRVYLIQRGDVILLCGGDKRTQDRDITNAKRLAKEDFE
jgi:putative addiction module killer protein